MKVAGGVFDQMLIEVDCAIDVIVGGRWETGFDGF